MKDAYLSLRLPFTHYDKLSYLAKLRGTSRSKIVRAMIKKYLRNNGRFFTEEYANEKGEMT